MLLRDYHELLRNAEHLLKASTPRLAEANANLLEQLEAAQRVVFTGAAFLACRQLAEHPDQLRRAQSQIFAPFPRLWMEFPPSETPNGTIVTEGFMWVGVGKGTRQGGLVYVGWPKGAAHPAIIPAHVDLDDEDPLKLAFRPGDMDRRIEGMRERFGLKPPHIPTEGEMRDAIPQILTWALAGWALMATHGMTVSTPVSYKKLNIQRKVKGLYPLLGFSEIRLNIDAERAVRAKQLAEASMTGRMPLHPVRAHLRLRANGRVEIVSAHMRGNPEYGIKSHTYRVERAEDQM